MRPEATFASGSANPTVDRRGLRACVNPLTTFAGPV